jgi:hypothetical protein
MVLTALSSGPFAFGSPSKAGRSRLYTGYSSRAWSSAGPSADWPPAEVDECNRNRGRNGSGRPSDRDGNGAESGTEGGGEGAGTAGAEPPSVLDCVCAASTVTATPSSSSMCISVSSMLDFPTACACALFVCAPSGKIPWIFSLQISKCLVSNGASCGAKLRACTVAARWLAGTMPRIAARKSASMSLIWAESMGILFAEE